MVEQGTAELIKVRESAAVWRQIDDETVLLALDSSTYMGVNHTGTQLWPAMVEGATRAELVGRLVSRFDVDEQRAAEDVEAFVQACRDLGLLEAG